ncbi:hypothetical protein DFH08DRAFT_832732, partial [Mycena albidolilacea]
MPSLLRSANDDDFAQLANRGAITRQLFVTCCIQCSCRRRSPNRPKPERPRAHPRPSKRTLRGTRTAGALSKALPHTMCDLGPSFGRDVELTEREQGDTDSTAHLVDTASSSNSESSKRGFLGKLKEKLVVSKADLEADRQRKEIERQKFLARRDKRRAEVDAEPKLEEELNPYGGFFTDGLRMDN